MKVVNYVREKLKSKKLRATLLGILNILLQQYSGLSDEQVIMVSGMVATYVLGQGVADAGKEAYKIDQESKK